MGPAFAAGIRIEEEQDPDSFTLSTRRRKDSETEKIPTTTYVKSDLLGSGQGGDVFKWINQKSGKSRAVKFLKTTASNKQEKDFANEIKIHSLLSKNQVSHVVQKINTGFLDPLYEVCQKIHLHGYITIMYSPLQIINSNILLTFLLTTIIKRTFHSNLNNNN